MANYDLGVLLYATQSGSGSYAKPDGTAGTVRTLSAANYIASDWFDAGRFADLYLTVSGAISTTMASGVVIVERKRVDANNGTLFGPAVVPVTRLDANTIATSTTITRAQLAGQSVSAWPSVSPATEQLDVVLFTQGLRWASKFRVLLLASGAPQSGDTIVIAANAGG
jgi:hypothetical protein